MAFGQMKMELVEQTFDEIQVEFSQDLFQLVEIEIDGQQYVDFSLTYKHVTLDLGLPQLPTFAESFVVPSQGKVSIDFLGSEFIDLEGIRVAPSKGNLTRNIDPSVLPYPFGEVYQQDAFFPEHPLSLLEPFAWRTIRGQVVHLCPFQYNPVTQVLRVYKKIQLRIQTDGKVKGKNEISNAAPSASDLKAFQHLLGNTVAADKYQAVSETGDVLLVYPKTFESTIQPLVDWKTKKGKKVHTVSLETIGANPSSADIKAYIANLYTDQPELKYVILVGDDVDVPTYSYGVTNNFEELYSDSYYGQLLGDDFYPELLVGRLSGDVTQVELMVNRILEYEINPKTGTWMTRAIGLASSQGAGYGDEGQADNQHMRLIRNQLIDAGYSEVFEFYDGSQGVDDAPGNPSSTMIQAAVNAGVGLFNYTGHGDLNTCITGNYSSYHIKNAENMGMYPYVVSVACNNGLFVGGTCISETWQRAERNGNITGAIATCGSTILMSWAPPMETQDEMTNIITSKTGPKSLGALFYNGQMSMLEQYPTKGVEVMQTWLFFGDPEMAYRNQVTATLEVEHPSCVPIGTSTDVRVKCKQEGAQVVLVQNKQILGQAKVNEGVAVISIPGVSFSDTIDVVVHQANYYPYQGQIYTHLSNCDPALSSDLGTLKIYPNPAKEQLTISYYPMDVPLEIALFDVSGKRVTQLIEIHKLQTEYVIELNDLAKGIYVLTIKDGESYRREKFIHE